MAPMLKPVDRPEGLGDQVYRTLRDYLGGHVIVPGQRLQEAPLAIQLGDVPGRPESRERGEVSEDPPVFERTLEDEGPHHHAP